MTHWNRPQCASTLCTEYFVLFSATGSLCDDPSALDNIRAIFNMQLALTELGALLNGSLTIDQN